jgi:hypothetical protein
MITKLNTNNFPVEFYIKQEGQPTVQTITNNKGYDIYVENLIISLSATDTLPISVNIQVGTDSFEGGSDFYKEIIAPQGIMTIPINRIVQSEYSEIKVQKGGNAIMNGRTTYVDFLLTGFKIPKNTLYNESYRIMVIGDSIDVLDGYQSYINQYGGHRNLKLIDGLRKYGLNCRLISKAGGGQSLNQAVTYMNAGLFDVPECEMIIIQMGANDIGQNVTESQFYTNLGKVKEYRDKMYKDAKLIIVKVAGSNQTGSYIPVSTSRNNKQALYNIQIDNFVSANTGKNIYSIDVFNNFDYTNNSLYADQVHLNDAGHQRCYEIMLPELKSILSLA